MIRFTVYGIPQPQGSSRAFMPKGAKFPVVTSDNPKLKSWRQELAKVAIGATENAMRQNLFCAFPLEKKIALVVTANFFFAKPKSAKKSTVAKTTKPDVDKLLRAALDGMTGIVYHDDSQVTGAMVGKFFGLPERAEIIVTLAE